MKNSALFVSSSLSAALFATTVFSTPAMAGKNDPANGLCDEYKGNVKAVCVQAHRVSNRIEDLKARGSSLQALRAAESQLERSKNSFMALTGLPVPGMTLPCEIPEINEWVETQSNLEILNSESFVRSSPDVCQVIYGFTSSYSEAYDCELQPSLTVDLANAQYSARDAVLGDPAVEGELRWCSYMYGPPVPADVLQLEACAISLGCDFSASAE